MNILNSSEAFSVMMAGKNIMCRAVGELIEFDDLNQFPATIFAQPGYEFCIKRETTVLAEIQFTKPVEPHDLEVGQEIYIVMPTCILRTQYDNEHGDICLSIANGFAQLDEENAKLQLQAFGKAFGNMITEIEVKDGFNDKPKKTRSSRKKPEEVAPIVVPTGTETEEMPWDEKPKATVSIEAELQLYLDALNVCDSADEVKTTLHGIEEIGFSESQLALIHSSKEAKLTLLALKKCDKPATQNGQYEKLMSELLEHLSKAQTAAEANALYKHTVHWDEEQRKPFIDAVHKRLTEISAESPSITRVPPSLQQRIESATDLDSLEVLEDEVLTRDPLIVPKLMGVGRKHSKRLHEMGIKTVFDLANAEPRNIKKLFSIVMAKTVAELQGVSCLDIESSPPAKKQIISSRSFGQRIIDIDSLSEAMSDFLQSAVKRLRNDGGLCGCVIAFAQSNPFDKSRPFYNKSISIGLSEPTDSAAVLNKIVMANMHQLFKEGVEFKKCGVVLTCIEKKSLYIPDLLSDTELIKKNEKLQLALEGERKVWRSKTCDWAV